MSFLKSVEAARALLREKATLCDIRDIATADTSPRAQSVAMSQLSQISLPADADDAVAKSQESQRVSGRDVEALHWRNLFDRYAAVRQYHGDQGRADAEAAALEDAAAQWCCENPLSSRLFSAGCVHCAAPVALETAVPVLAGRETGGRAWVHDACWRPMREARQREAREAVELLRRLR